MRNKKITYIKDWANQLGQFDVLEKHKQKALEWDETKNVCRLEDADADYLDSLWNNSVSRQRKKNNLSRTVRNTQPKSLFKKKPAPDSKSRNVSRKPAADTETYNLHNKWEETVRDIESGDNQDWKDELGRWRKKIEELENRGGCGCNKKAAEARKKRFMEMYEKWRDAVS